MQTPKDKKEDIFLYFISGKVKYNPPPNFVYKKERTMERKNKWGKQKAYRIVFLGQYFPPLTIRGRDNICPYLNFGQYFLRQ